MILLPRPQPHIASSVAFLRAQGFVNIMPLATSFPAPLSPAVPANATAIFVTSALALQCLIPHPQTKALPIYAVGPSTANAARQQGYTVAMEGTLNALSLATSMAKANLPTQHIWHLYGNNAPIQSFAAWQALLTAQGHTITSNCAYSLNPISSLTEQNIQTLRHKHPTHTLLFSVGSTQHLAMLLKQANIPFTGTAIALSSAVAAVAQNMWPHTVIAPQATLPGMVKALGQI